MNRRGKAHRALAIAAFASGVIVARGGDARAAGTAPSPAAPRGLVVLAEGDSTEAAWSLAEAVYADDGLRPLGLDEAHVRVLAGEPPADGAPADLRELAETRAAIHGDDAPSRQLLLAMANALGVRGIVVVEMRPDGRSAAQQHLDSNGSPAAEATPASAHVFVAATGAFDAARYSADAGARVTWGAARARVSWGGAASSLHRAYAPAEAPAATRAPPAATHELAPPARGEGPAHTAFYTSPWFWGALGAAAFGAGAVYFATRDNTPSAIHLHVQVP